MKQKANPSKGSPLLLPPHHTPKCNFKKTALLPDLHTTTYPKSSGNSGEYGDNDVENLGKHPKKYPL